MNMPDAAVAIGLLGILAAVAALATALVAFATVRRLRAQCASLEANLAALGREIGMAASINARTGSRVKRMEQQYSDVADRVELIESRGPHGSFDGAIDSARRGADPGKLTQQFGLSRSEAELLARLHGHENPA
jgi:Protein of unknown function (DUF2802)